MDRDARFLDALRRAVAGRQKLIAAEAFPEKTVPQAESELSAVLGGSRRPTLRLLRLALEEGEAEPLLEQVAFAARVRFQREPRPWDQLRQEAGEGVLRASEQLELAFTRLDEADYQEQRAEGRKGPKKVDRRRERRGAA